VQVNSLFAHVNAPAHNCGEGSAGKGGGAEYAADKNVESRIARIRTKSTDFTAIIVFYVALKLSEDKISAERITGCVSQIWDSERGTAT
jgi:hypothetical protein